MHYQIYSVKSNEVGGNKYLNMTVNRQASVITYDFYVDAGKYTFIDSNGTNKIFASENNVDSFEAVLINIPAANYDDIMQARPFAVDDSAHGMVIRFQAHIDRQQYTSSKTL